MKETMQKPWLTELEQKLADRVEQQNLYFTQTSKFIRREWDIEFKQLKDQNCHGINQRY
jgi:hypothetical protein